MKVLGNNVKHNIIKLSLGKSFSGQNKEMKPGRLDERKWPSLQAQ